MELIVCESLNQWQLAGVWRLLQVYGEEFVPPLSQRSSTCQQTLHGGATPSTQGPRAYFEEMKRQRFILAVEGEEVAGFLTFRYDYVPEILLPGKSRDCWDCISPPSLWMPHTAAMDWPRASITG